MKVPPGFAIGAVTHTGWVRANNEDDFLVASLPTPGPGLFVCAIADGMGGVAGGAEASRIALRALAAGLLDGAAETPVPKRVAAGFAGAAARVHEEASSIPALRDMGTTLTALCVQDGRAYLGHVGDTRAYRVRDGRCEQLTKDHAARQPENLLLRCIGGGHTTCEVDQAELPTRPGDRFLLATDGVWAAVPPPLLARLLGKGEPQAVAESLVAASLAAGGGDNATVLVLDVLGAGAGEGSHDVDLPRDERPSSRDLWPKPVSLRAPLWPWLVWIAAGALLGAALLRWVWGIDVWTAAALLAPSGR